MISFLFHLVLEIIRLVLLSLLLEVLISNLRDFEAWLRSFNRWVHPCGIIPPRHKSLIVLHACMCGTGRSLRSPPGQWLGSVPMWRYYTHNYTHMSRKKKLRFCSSFDRLVQVNILLPCCFSWKRRTAHLRLQPVALRNQRWVDKCAWVPNSVLLTTHPHRLCLDLRSMASRMLGEYVIA